MTFRRALIYLSVFMGCCGFVLCITHDGLHRLGDSDFYISAAQFHEHGEEMRNPIHNGTHDEFLYPSDGIFATWAPLLPWLLARLHQIGFSYDGAGRVMNAVSMGLSVVLMLWLMRGWLVVLQIAAVGMFLAHAGVVLSYTYLMSESLSLCLLLAFIALLSQRWQP